MIETTTETCEICGKEYKDTHVIPRAPYAPYWCDECEEMANEVCGGSWVAAVFQASKETQ